MLYDRPETLDEALAIRASRDVAVIAGGTDIYPAAVGRRAWGDPTHKDILDITRLSALRAITTTPDRVRIGALTTWTDLIETPLPALFDGLKHAARTVGGAQVQNRATLVGNLMTASPAGDGIPHWLALDAEVVALSRAGERRIKASDFLTGYRATALRPDELVVALDVPLPAGAARSTFLKLGARRYLVISIAMVAGVIVTDSDGRITSARFAVGACGPVARRLPQVEALLHGARVAEPLTSALAERIGPEHLADLTPIDDVRASASYRRDAALALVRDAVRNLTTTPTQRAA